MFTKQKLEKYLQKCLSTGADFAEIFLEESNYKTIKLSDEVIQNVYSDYIKGIGIRICLKDKTVYGCTNNIQNIDNIITRLISNFSEKPINNFVIRCMYYLCNYKNISLSYFGATANFRRRFL